MRWSLWGKLAALGGVLLGLAWALAMVRGLVLERSERLVQAQRGVAESLAGAQSLLGPAITRQCTETREATGEGGWRREASRSFTLTALPQQLSVDGTLSVEPRRRGIFRINTYILAATLRGEWKDLAALEPAAQAGARVQCDPPQLWLALSDPRGLRSVALQLDGHAVDALPGTGSPAYPAGLRAPLSKPGSGQPVTAAVQLELAGTEALAFVPIGKVTQVALRGDWPHPSFGGRHLPAERSVLAQGFTARWQTGALATRAPAELAAGAPLCPPHRGSAATDDESPPSLQLPHPAPGGCIESFGVSLVDPVSVYVLSDRASKYGLLFIVLSFVAVGLAELPGSRRVHPMQYLLVGAALAQFFLLLLALAEHLPFGAAYAIASVGCVLLLGWYGSSVLGSRRAGLVFGGGIALLYGVLYLLLQLSDGALLAGACLLFAVLAAVMVATRRVNWYALGGRRSDPA